MRCGSLARATLGSGDVCWRECSLPARASARMGQECPSEPACWFPEDTGGWKEAQIPERLEVRKRALVRHLCEVPWGRGHGKEATARGGEESCPDQQVMAPGGTSHLLPRTRMPPPQGELLSLTSSPHFPPPTDAPGPWCLRAAGCEGSRSEPRPGCEEDAPAARPLPPAP